MTWTKAEERALVRMKREGKSAAIIAEALGKTRSAVCGRAHRLGLRWNSWVCKQAGNPKQRTQAAFAPVARRLILACGC